MNDFAVLYVACGVTTLREDFPVVYFKSGGRSFVKEDHFCGVVYHLLIEYLLFCDGCDVFVVYQSQKWLKQAGFSTVGIANKTWYLLFVTFLIVI